MKAMATLSYFFYFFYFCSNLISAYLKFRFKRHPHPVVDLPLSQLFYLILILIQSVSCSKDWTHSMHVCLCVCACVSQESREQELERQLLAARWSTLQGAVEEGERIIRDSLAQIDDPAHISCTSSAGQTTARWFPK